MISSQPRYDHFDTRPNINFLYVKPSNFTKLKIKAKFRAKQSETMRCKISKTLKIQGFQVARVLLNV